jgi:hypothetical protein
MTGAFLILNSTLLRGWAVGIWDANDPRLFTIAPPCPLHIVYRPAFSFMLECASSGFGLFALDNKMRA